MSARQIRRDRERNAERSGKRRRRAGGKIAGSAGAALGATVLFAPAAQAESFEVDTLNDDLDNSCDDDCSIRDAVYEARQINDPDTITFLAGLTGTITLNDGSDIDIYNDSLTIQGPGAGVITVDGYDHRIFDLYGFDSGEDEVVISGLTLTDGHSSDGGAIRSIATGGEAADLTIADSVLTGNEATSDGGAIFAFYSALTIVNSQITDSNAAFRGGGVYHGSGDHDGSEDAATVISNSVISGNSAAGREVASTPATARTMS
jgi:hypothetical protein